MYTVVDLVTLWLKLLQWGGNALFAYLIVTVVTDLEKVSAHISWCYKTCSAHRQGK